VIPIPSRFACEQLKSSAAVLDTMLGWLSLSMIVNIDV
jgi:hypothetical protein